MENKYLINGKDYNDECLKVCSILDWMDKTNDSAQAAFDRALELLRDKESKYPDSEKYGNPLWEFQKIKLEETRYQLAVGLYTKWHEELTPNIKNDFKCMLSDSDDWQVREEADRKFRETGFLPHKLFNMFLDNCYKTREQLSKDYILERSKILLPSVTYGEKVKTVDEILKNKKLELKIYGKDRCGSELHKGEYVALTKLVQIVLKDASPSDVNNNLFQLDSVWFKNARLDIKFDSQEEARKVAEVLINGW